MTNDASDMKPMASSTERICIRCEHSIPAGEKHWASGPDPWDEHEHSNCESSRKVTARTNSEQREFQPWSAEGLGK